MRLNPMESRQAGQGSQSGKNGQTGSVILEAMIAMLIFSVGILGLIGMQTTAVGNVSDAKYRADASFFADQIIGQMWASRVATTNAAGLPVFTVDPTYTWPASAPIVPNTLVTAWAGASGVAGYLPAGSAVIAIEPINQQQVTVTLAWTPPKAKTQHLHTAVAFIN